MNKPAYETLAVVDGHWEWSYESVNTILSKLNPHRQDMHSARNKGEVPGSYAYGATLSCYLMLLVSAMRPTWQ